MGLGKHDVGSLSHSHRHGTQGRYGSEVHEGKSSHSVRSSRSHNVSGGE